MKRSQNYLSCQHRSTIPCRGGFETRPYHKSAAAGSACLSKLERQTWGAPARLQKILSNPLLSLPEASSGPIVSSARERVATKVSVLLHEVGPEAWLPPGSLYGNQEMGGALRKEVRVMELESYCRNVG